MTDRDIRILGVKHTDDRIHDGVSNEAEQVDELDVVYHEWPESTPDLIRYLFWLLLKNPSVIPPATIYAIRSMITMRRGFSVDSTGTTHIKSECKVAAERLRDNHGADLVNVGMNRTELLKQRGWFSAAQSWGIVLLGIWIVKRAVDTGNFAALWLLILPFGLAAFHRVRTLDKVRDTRDTHMTNTILEDYTEREAKAAFIIVGQKHIEGIASRLGGRFSPVCRWLSNEADLRDEG